MRAVNLKTLEDRLLFKVPDGFNAKGGNVGADGQYMYGALMEDLSDRIYTDLKASYIGMKEISSIRPGCCACMMAASFTATTILIPVSPQMARRSCITAM